MTDFDPKRFTPGVTELDELPTSLGGSAGEDREPGKVPDAGGADPDRTENPSADDTDEDGERVTMGVDGPEAAPSRDDDRDPVDTSDIGYTTPTGDKEPTA